jgi:hypothetical protein
MVGAQADFNKKPGKGGLGKTLVERATLGVDIPAALPGGGGGLLLWYESNILW